MNNTKFDVVIPVVPADFLRNHNNYHLMEKYLPVKQFVFIGPKELEEEINKLSFGVKTKYINENDILPFIDVNRAFINRVERAGYLVSKDSRLGWYYQQFLKMSYCYLSCDEYYLVWDSDTIPIRKIDLFSENGKPYLDVKIEHNQAYFDTIGVLFPSMKKNIEYSFISEHMLFNSNKMKEIIDMIMATDFYGNSYYEKIANAIDIMNMRLGFSEFETYGTYMYEKYSEDYEIRRWYSMRSAGYMFDSDKLTDEDINWLSKDFYALSFEKNNQVIDTLYEMFHREDFRKVLNPMQLYMKIQESGIFSGMKDG